LLYLGWKIIGSLSDNNKESGRPLRLYEAALFQFINPKAWVVALTAATAFFPSDENFVIATIFVAGTAPFVCIPSITIWALFGSSIKLIIQNTKIKKIIEYLLALLLVITAVIIVID
jgi:threonine/homoserine/homoserine lactone efflux protein